jgi:hypothetical protein
VEPVQVEEWHTGAPPAACDGPYWRAKGWTRVSVSKRRARHRHTRDDERRAYVDIRQQWWTADAVPDAPGGVPQTRRCTQGGGGEPVAGKVEETC